MPPKEVSKKPTPQIVRPPISNSSLKYIPSDAIEGYQERIETGIDWNLGEQAIRYHRHLCMKPEIPKYTFSEALQNKIKNSILHGFLNEESGLTLEQQWEILLPIILWDNEKFANDEEKLFFNNANNLTDDIIKLIKRAVVLGDRKVLRRELKMVSILRLNDAQMTVLDGGLAEFKKLVTLTLCGNFISNIDENCIPPGVKTLELQANRIKSVDSFVTRLPFDLLYLGLARNFIGDDKIGSMSLLPYKLSVLDLSANDIYDLGPLLDAIAILANLTALQLAGNPCSVCAAYARTTLMRLPRLKWLDCREVLDTDRSIEPFEPHPDDLRSSYFNFTIHRVMSAPQPPKAEKGAITTFHVELELPLLDATRRSFLMFRRNESLVEMLPSPEDEESLATTKAPSTFASPDASSHNSDIYSRLVAKNSREVVHFTTFESNRIQWNKLMTFQEPTVRIFCPDLVALRNTFCTVITVRLVYSMTFASKQVKQNKKSAHSFKQPEEQRVVLATVKCALRTPDWTQRFQHFHWDDSLGTDEAIHWGDGDLSILQYSQGPVKVTKGKPQADVGSLRQKPPENLTCHFGFGIDTLHA